MMHMGYVRGLTVIVLPENPGRRDQRRSLRSLRTVVLALSLSLLAYVRGFGAEFHGVGTVLTLNAPEATVVFDHEEIVGLMPPMKMGFPVASPDLLKDLKPGDRVQFTLEAQGSMVVITAIGKAGD